MALGRKCPDGLAVREVDNRDLPCVGHIDKGSSGAFVDLKTLRVRLEADAGYLCSALRVDNDKRTLAVPYEHLATSSIDPDVIGILAQIDAPFARQVFRP